MKAGRLKGHKKLSIIILVVCVVAAVSAAIFAASTLYDQATVVFEGIHMKMGADGNIQGILDVSLRDVRAIGVSFSLYYDPEYLEPSDYETNHINDDLDEKHKLKATDIIKLNSVLMAEEEKTDEEKTDETGESGTTGETGATGESGTTGETGTTKETENNKENVRLEYTPMSSYDAKHQMVNYGFSAKKALEVDGRTYIQAAGENNFEFVADGSEGLLLGSLSFRIKNPAGLGDKDIEDILYIAKTPIDEDLDLYAYGVTIQYYDPSITYEEGKGAYTAYDLETARKRARFNWNVTDEVTAVMPNDGSKDASQKRTVRVLAPEVYYHSSKKNTIDDLIEYANKYYNKVSVLRSNLSQMVDTVTWGDKELGFTVTGDEYDPKGGTYTFTQYYDNAKVHSESITFEVEPVTLLGFYADNSSLSKTYLNSGDEHSTIPENDGGLDLPDKAYAVLDHPYDLAEFSEPLTEWKYTIAETSKSTKGTAGENKAVTDLASNSPITMTAAVPTADLENYKWLTYKAENTYSISVVRGAESSADDLAKKNTEKPVLSKDILPNMDSDVLTVTVDTLGTKPVPKGTVFKLYLPNGITLTTGETSGVTADIPDGGGTATVKVSINSLPADIKDSVKDLITAGSSNSNIGDFEITATESGNYESYPTDFTLEAVKNYYKNNIFLDLRDTNKAHRSDMLPMAAGLTADDISTYIDLSAYEDSCITEELKTTFDGRTGEADGVLKAAKVTGWQIYNAGTDGKPTGDPISALPEEGSSACLVGELATHNYSDYGTVYNTVYDTENNLKYTVTIAVTTKEAKASGASLGVTVSAQDVLYGSDATAGENDTYVYGTLKTHYDTAPSETFTITNTGNTTLNGLTVQTGNKDFVIETQPSSILSSESMVNTTQFVLRAKRELKAGEHTAKVYVTAIDAADGTTMQELKSFDVTLVVTAKNTYTVNLSVNDPLMGTAVLEKGTTYTEGTEVTINYTPAVDYEYDSNTNDHLYPSKVNDGTSGKITFEMPAQDVNIEVNFKDTWMSALHLNDLRIYDKDGVEQLPLQITEDDEKTWKDSVFKPELKKYRVVVKSTTDMAEVKFKVKYLSHDQGAYIGDTILTVAKVEESDPSGNREFTDLRATANYTLWEYSVGPFGILPLEKTNKVTITRYYEKDPDKKREVEIYIIRRPEINPPLGYGNSPYGLIARQFANETDTSKKGEWQTGFSVGSFPYRFESNMVPDTIKNTDYANMTYSKEAWGNGPNIDQDETAVFVYIGDEMTFQDPGWRKPLTDTKGEIVQHVTAKIALDVYPNEYDGTTNPVDFYNSAVRTEIHDFTTSLNFNRDGKATYWGMNKLNIRPGVYKIEYSFEDSSDGGEVTFDRNLVVLPKPGNLRSRYNADLSKDSEAEGEIDYNILYTYTKSGLVHDIILDKSKVWHSLLAYRVMDVNNDKNVNIADAHEIKKAVKETKQNFKGMYIPLKDLPTISYTTMEGGG